MTFRSLKFDSAVFILICLGGVFAPSIAAAQGSPVCREGADTTSIAIADQTVSVCYVSTSARGRLVFGYPLHVSDARWLVPFDTLWQTGVVLHTPVAIEAAGVALSPGSYSVYAVPAGTEWTVIFNRNTAHLTSGAAYDDVASDEVGRAIVRSTQHGEYVDRLTVSGESSGSSSVALSLTWERTSVHIPVRLATGRGRLACEFRGAADRLASRPSPLDSVDVTIGNQRARLCYGRPSARDRTVFGGLVPYNDLWRLGANEPTILHIPVAASIAGIDVEPGDYAILVIPSRKEWTVVVTASTSQWGRVETTTGGARSQYTDAVRAREVGRSLIPSETTQAFVETFTISAQPAGMGADLVAEWERTRIRIPVRAR